MKKILSTLLSLVLCLCVFVSCSKNDPNGKGTKGNPVKIGVVNASDEQWSIFKKKAEEKNVYVDIINFQDYTSENPALDSYSLDMNQFQHVLYLANYNYQKKDDLVPIGSTAIFPIGLYSKSAKNIKEIKKGVKIAIPNDDTNQSRAIDLLEEAGLVKLKRKTLLPSPLDVDTSNSKVKVVPVKAEQTPNALNDPTIGGAIINSDFIGDADVDLDDAIYKETDKSKDAKYYTNIFAVRNVDRNKEIYLKIVSIFHDKEVEKALQKTAGGTAIIKRLHSDYLKLVLNLATTEIKNNEKSK